MQIKPLGPNIDWCMYKAGESPLTERIMHLAINIMPHYPLLGYVGEQKGNLTCFDTKTCPIRGEFDLSPYACAIIKSTDGQILRPLLDF